MTHRVKNLFVALASAALTLAAVSALATAAPSTSAAAPENVTKPTITDADFTVGDIATAQEGSWSGTPVSYAYRWQRCDRSGGGCVTIGGATAKTYVLQAADIDRTLVVEVTATNADGSTVASSDPSPVVTGNAAPVSTAMPAITGSAVHGQTLTASEGTWSNGVRSFSYQWSRCNAGGQQCADLAGATGKTYTVVADDVGQTLRVRVTATNPSGSQSATSERSEVVRPAPTQACGTDAANTTLLPNGTRSVDIQHVSLPNQLVIDRVSFTPRFIRSRSETVTARFHVKEAIGGCSVKGALVYAVAIPFARVTKAPETATAADGWVNLRYQPTARLPLRKGYLLTFFVRARKGGEPLLAGVRATRLVALRIDPTR